MKRLGSRRVRWVCALTAVALALMSLLANSVQTIHDKQKVAKMSEKVKTVCVGRFLIDLPAQAQVAIRHGSVGGLDISSTDQESQEAFAARLRETERDIAGAVNRDGQPSLEASRQLTVGEGQGKTFVFNRRRTKVLEGDGVVFSENLALRGMLRFPNVSITGDVEWIADRHIDSVTGILRRVRPLASGEIPRESGFCLKHALVQDPYAHANLESVVMFAGLPGHPDVNIVLSSMAGADPAPGLLERNADAVAREPVFMRLAFTHLREGAHQVNDLAGEQLVMRVREPNFTTGYAFQWEAAGRPDDVYAPRLKLELEAGVNPVAGGRPVQSTLSEEALFALWDGILGSIRLRPHAPVAAATPAPERVALGTGALAGDACPQSGWWQCADGGNGVAIFGGQRQFIKQGQRMPQALLLPPQTMWQRLRGVQPSYESANATLWSLADRRHGARVAQPSGLAHALAASEPGLVPAAATPSAHGEIPIGSIAKTGMACPASGWWRCEDSHALDGTRWFAAGSLLPAAAFRGQFGPRSSAHPACIHRRSAWQLMRHAQAAGALDAALAATEETA